MTKRQSKEEKLDRIVDRLYRLYCQLVLNFQNRKPFEVLFELKNYENYKGLLEFSKTQTSITFSITLLTSIGASLHRFEVSHILETSENPISYCTFTSLPYNRGQALENLKIGFTHRAPFEAYIRQMVLTSCKRDALLVSLVACLEKATNLMELEKNFTS